MILPSYAFINLALNSKINTSTSAGTIIEQRVDLVAGLNNVANTQQANDAELQQAFADVFVPLHDAHTRYNKVCVTCTSRAHCRLLCSFVGLQPPPYRYSAFTQPFQFSTVTPSGSALPILRLHYNPFFIAAYKQVLIH